MNLTDQKIEEELKVKRIKPEAFIAKFEEFFTDVANTYQVSLGERWQQRRNRRAFSRPFRKFNRNHDFSKIAKKVTNYAEKVERAQAKGKPVPDIPNFEAMLKDLESRNDFILNFDTNLTGFEKILDEYHINQLRDQLTGSAVNGWLVSWAFGFITKLVILGLTILVSLYVEEPMSKFFKPLGETKATILTTMIVYFSVDLLIDWLKDQLLWQRVKTCYRRFKAVRQIINLDWQIT